MNDIIPKLEANNYLLLKNKSEAYFDDVVNYLGQSFRKTSIQISEAPKTKLETKHRMDFHTDPKAKYIAWYCVKQSSVGGESLIIDFADVVKALDENSFHNLKKLKTIDSYQNVDVPFYDESNGEPNFYYSPWRISKDDKTKYEKELIELSNVINNIQPIKILLDPNDILLIKNKRVLHTRSEIGGDFNRLIIRHLIV